MPNITESQIAAAREVSRLLYEHGANMGQEVKNLIEQGDLNPNGTVRLTINAQNIRNMKLHAFPLATSLLMKFGTTEVGIAANSAIVVAGVYSGGSSAMGYSVTKNRVAKGLYAVSMACSGTAVANGGAAVMARACELSQVGMLAEAFGLSFMMLGNMAHVAAPPFATCKKMA